MHLNLNFLRSINKLWKSQSRYDIYFSFTFISYRFNDITQFIQHYFWNELMILLQGLTAVLFFFTLASRNMSFVKYGLTLEYIHIYFKVYNINIRNWKKRLTFFKYWNNTVIKKYFEYPIIVSVTVLLNDLSYISLEQTSAIHGVDNCNIELVRSSHLWGM